MLKRRNFLYFALGVVLVSCAPNADAPKPPSQSSSDDPGPLVVGAIPDQDPEQLQRLYGKLSTYLSQTLKVPVTYKPVTDYAAAVTAFRVGDLDLVWFGGLTGVQARLQVPQAQAIAQRDIDEKFTSVFIAHRSANLSPLQSASDLKQLSGKRMTFGSESSTSGRLMPQFFLKQNGVTLKDFQGDVGFSSSHDATLKLVEAGTYEVGVLNSQVWRDRLKEGKIDTQAVQVIWETPPYYDYHWVVNPQINQRYGNGFADQVQAALLALDVSIPAQKDILELFGATRFIPTENKNYDQIERIGREIGKIQ